MPHLHRIRSYSEMASFDTLKERYDYLRLEGSVGRSTFGSERYLNQAFYHSSEWRRIRREILIRDDGCELGLAGYPIGGRVYLHHINPIKPGDIVDVSGALIDPENLVCVSFRMHQAIHYGDISAALAEPLTRSRNDTCPWKGGGL